MAAASTATPRPIVLDPTQLQRLSAAEVDRLLDQLESTVATTRPWVDLVDTGAREAILFGDTHGDWRSTVSVVRTFLAGSSTALVGLGDYVDRTPADCPNGSVLNALYLLQVAATYAPRVVLIRGNHETTNALPVAPRSFEDEAESAWGPSPLRAERISRLLNRGPIAATSRSGAYLAHAGFPRAPWPEPWTRAIDPTDRARLAEIAWADCAASRNRRGVAPPFHESDTLDFLAKAGLTVFVRGHDPDLTRRPIYDGRCLTLHTTRYYQRYGGVILARLPLDRAVSSVVDLALEDVPAAPVGKPPARNNAPWDRA